jgi:hypothetical protein
MLLYRMSSIPFLVRKSSNDPKTGHVPFWILSPPMSKLKGWGKIDDRVKILAINS